MLVWFPTPPVLGGGGGARDSFLFFVKRSLFVKRQLSCCLIRKRGISITETFFFFFFNGLIHRHKSTSKTKTTNNPDVPPLRPSAAVSTVSTGLPGFKSSRDGATPKDEPEAGGRRFWRTSRGAKAKASQGIAALVVADFFCPVDAWVGRIARLT